MKIKMYILLLIAMISNICFSEAVAGASENEFEVAWNKLNNELNATACRIFGGLPADPMVAEWVNTELKQSGLKCISVYTAPDKCHANRYGITIPDDWSKLIKQDALRNKNKRLWYPWNKEVRRSHQNRYHNDGIEKYGPVQWKLNSWNRTALWNPKHYEFVRDVIRGVIWHESGHIKYGDTSSNPFAESCLKKVGLSEDTINPITMAHDDVFTYSALAAISFGRYRNHFRFQEKRADEFIPNDPDLLKAQVRLFTELAKEERPWYQKLYRAITNEHPSDAARAKRFKERLDALEK